MHSLKNINLKLCFPIIVLKLINKNKFKNYFNLLPIFMYPKVYEVWSKESVTVEDY